MRTPGETSLQLNVATGDSVTPSESRQTIMCAPALHETLLDDSRCWRDQLSSAGYGVKMALGLVFVAIGALVLSGFDKAIETALVNASPQWLTDLTTRF